MTIFDKVFRNGTDALYFKSEGEHFRRNSAGSPELIITELHRLDGPAIDVSDLTSYFVDGVSVPKEFYTKHCTDTYVGPRGDELKAELLKLGLDQEYYETRDGVEIGSSFEGRFEARSKK